LGWDEKRETDCARRGDGGRIGDVRGEETTRRSVAGWYQKICREKKNIFDGVAPMLKRHAQGARARGGKGDGRELSVVVRGPGVTVGAVLVGWLGGGGG